MQTKKYKVACFTARSHGLNGLESLINDNRFEIDCVFTHALNPKSEDHHRNQREDFIYFKKITSKYNIQLISIDTIADKKFITDYFQKCSGLDFIVSISWRYLIPKIILDEAKFGGINLHRGKLPNYPGAAPIEQALNKNEKYIYITSHVMTDVIDHGKILSTVNHPTNYEVKDSLDTNVKRLKEEITSLFGPLLIDSLNQLINKHDFLDT